MSTRLMNMKEFFKSRNDRIISSVLAALALPFLLFVSVPFEIFGNNLAESKFAASDFLGTSFLLFFLVALVFFIIMYFIPKKPYRIFKYIIVALAALALIQGTYINSTNAVAGDSLSTAPIPVVGIIFDYILWVVFIAGAVVLGILKDKKSYIKTGMMILSIVVIFTQAVNMVTLSASTEGIFDTKLQRDGNEFSTTRVITDKDFTTISKNKNVFYFIIDRFDEEYAQDAYLHSNELFDNLDGFTWFKDNIALYGHTYPAVAYLITDNMWRAKDSLRLPYYSEAYQNATPLEELNSNGYKINLYTLSYYSYDNSCIPTYINNSFMSEYQVTDNMGLSIELTGWSLSRCLPFLLRDTIRVSSSTYNYYTKIKNDAFDYQEYVDTNKTVYDYVDSHDFTEIDDNLFSLIHVSGCHEAEPDYSTDNTSTSRSNSLKNSFHIINKFIDELKESGAYDDATIIITGDHGVSHGDTSPLSKPVLTALFFKPSGSSNTPLQQSLAQVSQANTWPTIMKSLDIKDSKYYTMDGFYDIDPTKTYERTQIWQTFCSYLDEYVYTIKGPGSSFDSWELIETDHYDRHVMN